MLFGYSAGHL